MSDNKIKAFFNQLAPHWNDAESKSQDEIYAFLNEYLPIKKTDHVLDIGCGTGIASPSLQRLGKSVKAIDLSDEMIKIARETHEGIDFEVMDFYDVEGKYDFIVCFNAYPHFIEVEKFRDKAYSLLSEGGKLAVIHNISRAQLSTHHAPLKAGLSRELLPVEEEVKPFLSKFEVERTIDNEKMFLMLLQK